MDEFAKNGVLEFQLDAVGHGFQSDVNVKVPRILDPDDGRVHENHGQVDDEELQESASVVTARP